MLDDTQNVGCNTVHALPGGVHTFLSGMLHGATHQARSKPMKEIVARLLAFGEFEVFYFGDKVGLSASFTAGWQETSSYAVNRPAQPGNSEHTCPTGSCCMVIYPPAYGQVYVASCCLMCKSLVNVVLLPHLLISLLFVAQVILEEAVDAWPLCDAMLSWHSDGFPLKKAQQYAVLRKPFLVNDVVLQDALLDRRRVYKILMVCRACWCVDQSYQ